MRDFGKYILTLLIICNFVEGQKLFGQPTSISIATKTLCEIGYNSSGADTNEDTDYVTVGSTVPYYMLPDATVNAGFNNSLLDNAANNNLITSTFDWQVTGGTATAVGGIYKGNYVNINWTATGNQTIETFEHSAAGCDGNTVTTNVVVIPAPTVTAVDIANISCISSPIDEALTTSTISITSSVPGATNKGFEASYTLTGPGAYSQTGTDVAVSDAGVLDLSGLPHLTSAGAYTLTITAISDRISSKCGVTPAVISVSKTFYLIPLPATGKTMHVPNDAAW